MIKNTRRILEILGILIVGCLFTLLVAVLSLINHQSKSYQTSSYGWPFSFYFAGPPIDCQGQGMCPDVIVQLQQSYFFADVAFWSLIFLGILFVYKFCKRRAQ